MKKIYENAQIVFLGLKSSDVITASDEKVVPTGSGEGIQVGWID